MILQSNLYEGEITHARTKPVKHNFSFPIYTFVLDLDELELLDEQIRFFGSTNIPQKFSKRSNVNYPKTLLKNSKTPVE